MTLNYAVPVGMVKLVCYDDRAGLADRGRRPGAPRRRAQLRPGDDPAAGAATASRARAPRPRWWPTAPRAPRPGGDRAAGPGQRRDPLRLGPAPWLDPCCGEATGAPGAGASPSGLAAARGRARDDRQPGVHGRAGRAHADQGLRAGGVPHAGRLRGVGRDRGVAVDAAVPQAGRHRRQVRRSRTSSTRRPPSRRRSRSSWPSPARAWCSSRWRLPLLVLDLRPAPAAGPGGVIALALLVSVLPGARSGSTTGGWSSSASGRCRRWTRWSGSWCRWGWPSPGPATGRSSAAWRRAPARRRRWRRGARRSGCGCAGSAATLRGYWSFSAPLLVAGAAGFVMAWSAVLAAKLDLGVAAVGVITLALHGVQLHRSRRPAGHRRAVPGDLRRQGPHRGAVRVAGQVKPAGADVGGAVRGRRDAVRVGSGRASCSASAGTTAVVLLQVYGVTAAVNHVGFNWTAYFRALGRTRPIATETVAAAAVFLAAGIPLLLAFGLPGFAAGIAAQAAAALVLRAYWLQQLFPGFDFLRHAARAFLPTVPAVGRRCWRRGWLEPARAARWPWRSAELDRLPADDRRRHLVWLESGLLREAAGQVGRAPAWPRRAPEPGSTACGSCAVGNRYPPWSTGGYETTWAVDGDRAARRRPSHLRPHHPARPDRPPGRRRRRPPTCTASCGWYWHAHRFPGARCAECRGARARQRRRSSPATCRSSRPTP